MESIPFVYRSRSEPSIVEVPSVGGENISPAGRRILIYKQILENQRTESETGATAIGTESARPQGPRAPASHAGVGRHAFLVAAGIFLSRIAGLVRERVIAYFLGNESVAADALRGALRIPNILQNLFGEGVLSASFIPVYARLVAQEEEEESGRVAGAILSLLSMVVAVLVLAGVMATPWIIDAIVPGFKGETRALTIRLVRILFPGVGLLVISAWCLGILNSHRRFFLSYASSVVWNGAIVGALLLFRACRHGSTCRLCRLGIGSGQRTSGGGPASGGVQPGAEAASGFQRCQ